MKRELWRLRGKKRTDKKLGMDLIFRKVYETLILLGKRERHLFMTAPTISFEVTGILTFPCYSSHMRYK